VSKGVLSSIFGGVTSSAGNPATHLTVTGTTSPIVAGVPQTVTITALDAGNALAIGYSGTVVITSTDAGAALPANFKLTNGVGTCSVTLKTVGTQTITATDSVTGSITGVSGNITVNLAAAAKLVWTVQPATTAHTSTITPSPAVSVEDAFGNVITTGSGSAASVAVVRNIVSGSGVLSGTSPVTASAGVATFTDLAISLAGTYTLTASSAGLTSATSAQVVIS